MTLDTGCTVHMPEGAPTRPGWLHQRCTRVHGRAAADAGNGANDGADQRELAPGDDRRWVMSRTTCVSAVSLCLWSPCWPQRTDGVRSCRVCGVSLVSTRPAVSCAQIRAQMWLLRAWPSQLRCRVGTGGDCGLPRFAARSDTQQAGVYFGQYLIRRSVPSVRRVRPNP
jgi:hypothetical protein